MNNYHEEIVTIYADYEGEYSHRYKFITSLLKYTAENYSIYYRKLYSHEQLDWASKLFLYFVRLDDKGTAVSNPLSCIEYAIVKFRKSLAIPMSKIRAFREAVTVAYLVCASIEKSLKELLINDENRGVRSKSDKVIVEKCFEAMRYFSENDLVNDAEKLPCLDEKESAKVCFRLALEYGHCYNAAFDLGLEKEDKIMTTVNVEDPGLNKCNDWYYFLQLNKTTDLNGVEISGSISDFEWFDQQSVERKRALLIISCETYRRVLYEKRAKLRDRDSGSLIKDVCAREIANVLSEFSRATIKLADVDYSNLCLKKCKNRIKSVVSNLIFALFLSLVIGSCIKMTMNSPYGDKDPPDDWPYTF